jgi:hypothetical protein
VIGKVVQGQNHLTYVAQIYGAGEVDETPQPADYALGTFVRVALAEPPGGWLVGLIYDTTLLNPEFGRFGPRLSPLEELAVFSPDYLNEKAVLVGIMMLGSLTAQGQASQEVPQLAARTDSRVERLTPAQLRRFHGPPDAPQLVYIPRLLALNSPLVFDVVGLVLGQLRPLYPQAEILKVFDLLADELRWQRQVAPFGGGR